MQDAYRPVAFQRHTHQLRAVLIDRQPCDFARLINARRPYRLPQRMDPEQKHAVILEYLSGFHEEVEVISESGAYKALYRFWHPEHRNIAKWLSDEVLPILHDSQHIPGSNPQRTFMTWADQRIGVIKRQGEIWIARRDLPTFLAAQDDWPLRDAPSWRSI
ncbi:MULTISPECIES: phage antirepressor [Pseudomonas]|uniref:phage antirepressor n=1 Tax=Pseudomonas TaxID=286 RepID=UPI001E3B5454|nr:MULTISPECIES: phage antirepressor [Pseudomonas]MCE4073614.1 phage antirepressor [Pseudomonas nitritireducens]MCE4082791.1 phage antirepressor [Pseudomonas nitroreducens]